MKVFRWQFCLLLLGLFSLGQIAAPSYADGYVFPDGANVVNVKMPPYNAKGDGVTDDTAAINAALAANRSNRAIVYLPDGTYLVSNTLQFPLSDAQSEVFGYLTLQGQTRSGAIIRLKNKAPGFTNAALPKAVVNTGNKGYAALFRNAVRGLSIKTGTGNVGAIGLQFMSNNQGTVKDVTICSEDKKGVYGLDLGYKDNNGVKDIENGPLLVKAVEISGFNVGIRANSILQSQTLEDIYLHDQIQFGLTNNGQALSIHNLRSNNRVTAIKNTSGILTLVDATLTGFGTASGVSAIVFGETLYGRNIATSGYARAINNTDAKVTVTGPNVEQYVSTPPLSLFLSPPRSLNLPVQNTPDVNWDDPATWANVRDFGARGDGPLTGRGQYRGGDGFQYDSANWGNPIVTKADGTVKHLAGEYDYRYAGGPQHTLAADEIAFDQPTSTFDIAFPSIDIPTVKIRGQAYPRSLNVAFSDLRYKLNGEYVTFSAKAGIDDSVNGEGSIQFEVYADGVLVYNSYVVYGSDPVLPISLNVAGVQELRIRTWDGKDDTEYIQAAIDSGASTVYLPRGTNPNYKGFYSISSPVQIRASVRRVLGTEATIVSLTPPGTPALKFVDGIPNIVVLERFESAGQGNPFIEHASSRTLVIRNASAGGYVNTGFGDLFLQDVGLGGTFKNQNVWARQLNVETNGTHLTNDGGNLWILGYKTEGGGTLIETKNGGKTELLGGLAYAADGNLAPMFINNESSVSVSFGEISFNGAPFSVLVRETRNGVTRSLNRGGGAPIRFGNNGSALPLYTGYIDANETAPFSPTSLTATAQDSSVQLSWKAVSGAYGYEVKRGLAQAGPFTTIASEVRTTRYQDLNAVNGTTYYYVVTARNSAAESGISNVAKAKPLAGLTGTGLTGRYFSDVNFTTPLLSRLDSTINFNAVPFFTGGPTTNFSTIWTGKVRPATTGTYTFYVTGDDGVRLTVNGQVLVNALVSQAPTEYSGTITLTAKQKYDIKLEYFQGGGGGAAILSWAGPSVTKRVIPREQLYAN